ncbi:heme exporter protein CcmD [Candidatus Odyssella thessalonicensis]|nr:heme exporter protein CcmD [Candidatus Odyssella thessalonicensis]
MTQLSYVYLAYGCAITVFMALGIKQLRKMQRLEKQLDQLES